MRKLFFASILVTLLLGIWIGSSGYHKAPLAWAAGKNYDRYRVNMAIPLNDQGNIPAWFRQPFVLADFNIDASTTRLQAWKRITRRFLNRCENIGAGTPREEQTTSAKRHNCNHDLFTACDTEVDLTDN